MIMIMPHRLPWLQLSPWKPGWHPFRQLPLMWWHRSLSAHFPQSLTQSWPYCPSEHSIQKCLHECTIHVSNKIKTTLYKIIDIILYHSLSPTRNKDQIKYQQGSGDLNLKTVKIVYLSIIFIGGTKNLYSSLRIYIWENEPKCLHDYT